MLSDTISPETLIFFAIGLCSLMLIVYLDRYFTSRRSVLANELYAQRLSEGRKDSPLHSAGFDNRRQRNRFRTDLIFEPEIEVRRPGFFSLKRVVTDTFGNPVAIHYQELVVTQPENRRLMLLGS
jgi:hypothetical protein